MSTDSQTDLLAKIAALVNDAKADRPRTTIKQLVDAYAEHAERWYDDTIEAGNFRRIGELLIAECGADFPADEFGPKMLKRIREAMIDKGWIRSSVNRCAGRVKTMFKYAAEEELIAATTWHALLAVRTLPPGRSRAKEGEPVRPVEWPIVLAASFYMTAPVRALVWLQWFTGARGGELMPLTPSMIDTSGDVWRAVLEKHKTAHRGHKRVLLFGPVAQAIIRPFLDRPDNEYLFCPKEGRRESLVRRTRDGRDVRVKAFFHRSKYNKNSYCRSVARACEMAGVAHFHPHQLRHSAGTRIRARHGLDAAMHVLGHADARTTERYAEPDATRATEAMAVDG